MRLDDRVIGSESLALLDDTLDVVPGLVVHPHAIFRRALARRNLPSAEEATRELPRLNLVDALELRIHDRVQRTAPALDGGSGSA